MSDLWEEQTKNLVIENAVKRQLGANKKQDLLSEITYLLYRLQQLGEESDRVRAYRDKIEQMLEEL